ncbi:MAG: hypothetical protein IJ049_02300 [Oscillospiraceae bacterium]|nr:hypothetical protein [Oscillospiraceae bacterium]
MLRQVFIRFGIAITAAAAAQSVFAPADVSAVNQTAPQQAPHYPDPEIKV